MVYSKGKMKGQLTTAEIRKLISAHNKLSKITIPPKSKRDDILKILKDNGFSVNHERQRLEQVKVQKKDVDLEQAKEITKRKPRAKPVPKPKPKPLPKEDEVRPKEKVGRPKVDPKKIQVIVPKPKEEKPKPKKKVLAIEDKPKQEKPKRNFKVNRSERKKLLGQLIDDTGGRMINLHKVLGIKSSDETPELVKKKCKELKLKFHPDKNNEPDQDKFDLVQKVCRILLDTQEIIQDKPKKDLDDADIKKMLREELDKIQNKGLMGSFGPFRKLKKYPNQFNTNTSVGDEDLREDVKKSIKEIKSKLSKQLLDKLIITFTNSDNSDDFIRYDFESDKILEEGSR